MINREYADGLLKQADEMFTKTAKIGKTKPLRCGVDLGTASIILAVLDEDNNPAACEMQTCQVAKDGLVVDYMGAVEITKALKGKLEQRLGRPVETAAIAVPPGTNKANSSTHRYIVEAAGMEVTSVLDEPTAANAVLGIENGVVVDIGGGTTGLSVFKNGEVVYVADEATGGIHISLVLMGRYKIDYAAAEALKQDSRRQAEIRMAALPVMQKMAGIVKQHIAPYSVEEVWLVGGTCCLDGIETVFSNVLNVPVHKPLHPMMVTPLGIALNCEPG